MNRWRLSLLSLSVNFASALIVLLKAVTIYSSPSDLSSMEPTELYIKYEEIRSASVNIFVSF